MKMRDWDDFDIFERAVSTYMLPIGEGETMASQIVTAVNKLVYKWYNDGDVFDNTHYMTGWANDLSSYANWLYKKVPKTRSILDQIAVCDSYDEYADILFELALTCLDMNFLGRYEDRKKTGSIYDCDGKFKIEYREDND